MEIGDLRSRIYLQTYTETPVGNHDVNPVWTSIKGVWAKIVPAKALTVMLSMQTDKAITHKIYIRYQENITTEHWILFESKRYRIRGVVNMQQRNRFLELSCEEVGYAQSNFRTGINHTGDPLNSDL